MTTYATGNPLGSTNPKDLKDNAENFDKFANGPDPAYPDRFGNQRKSIQGMNADFEADQASCASTFTATQAEKQAAFDAFILSSGYYDIGDYDDGPLTLIERNQIFHKDGELWKAAASLTLPYTTVSDWVADNPKFVSVGDAALRQELASVIGASYIGFTREGIGAVPETVSALLHGIRVSIKSFGGKCDALTTGTDDTAAVKYAIAWVKLMGGGEVFNPGLSVITDTLTAPFGVTLVSIGKGYEKRPVGGYIFRGTGPKVHSIPGATAISVANPDSGAPYLADSGTRGNTYRTLDLSVPFSVGIILEKGAKLKDMGVIPWFDGLDGYVGEDARLSDDWDVGVWCRNASGWQTENVIIDGHWRKTGILLSSSDIGDGQVPQCELGQALNCSFGGFRGVAIRAPRDAVGSTNYGFAGTDFINCFIRSLNHQSLHLATSSQLTAPLASPSATLELDGAAVLRGVQFLNCTFMGRDDISVISDHSSEILFSGCYEESKSIRVSGTWFDNLVGSRVVATSNTAAFFWHSNTKYAVDFSPYFTKDTNLSSSRYDNAKVGVFNPATSQDSEWERPNFSGTYGIRLRTGQTFRIYNKDFISKYSVTDEGAVNASGNIVITHNDAGLYSNANPMVRKFSSGTVQLGLGVASISDGTMTNPGIIRHATDNTWSFGSPTFRATVVYATTAAINVSDERHKLSIQGVPEKVLDAFESVEYAMYQMDDAFEQKGDGARWHFGVIAQRVKEAFDNHGLDPFSFGLLCFDEWGDVYDPVIEKTAVQDEEGNQTVTERETGERRLVKEAGSRYGIRYEELLCLQAALYRRDKERQLALSEDLNERLDLLLKRIDDLEVKLIAG